MERLRHWSDAQVDAALKRGRIAAETEPRAMMSLEESVYSGQINPVSLS